MRTGTIVGLLLCAVLVLMQCDFSQQNDFSYVADYDKKRHAGHQIFRLKKGYHFFRLKKDQECIIGEEARALLADIVKSAQSGSLCPADRQVISEFVQNICTGQRPTERLQHGAHQSQQESNKPTRVSNTGTADSINS